jgi:hypothetical protein
MLILGVEGVAAGKCGKSVTFDTCRPTMFSFLKQNTGLRTVRMLPMSGGEIITMTPQKSQKDCFNAKKNREIKEVVS